jgi:spore coat protein U-like protein
MKSKSLQRLTASVFFRTLCIVAGIAMSAATLQARAASATGNLTVSASVSQKCTVSTSAVSFGEYDAVGTNATTALDAEGSLSIKCTKGSTSITLALDNGANYDSGNSTRRLKSGTDYLNYNIYQPTDGTANSACDHTTVWNTTNTLTPSGVTWGTASAATFKVCGRAPAGQDAAIGANYSDTVQATVNF